MRACVSRTRNILEAEETDSVTVSLPRGLYVVGTEEDGVVARVEVSGPGAEVTLD